MIARTGVMILAVVSLAVGPTACGADQDGGPSGQAPSSATAGQSPAPETSNPYGAPPIDPPAPDEPVLAVTGGSTQLSLTMDRLEALGDTTITVDEPFVKKRETFSGVPLAAVLAEAGIPPDATIDTVAINAYHYTSVAEPMIDSQALIATKREGEPIPYDQGGPIRIVFPDGTPLSSVLDAWNWSLSAINVTAEKPSAP